MRAVARATRIRRDKSARQFELAKRTILGFSGAFMSIAGIVLTAGGLMSAFDGSSFYTVTGLGLTISGALIAKRNRAGAWTYLAVFAATVSWSLRNVDQAPTARYRLVGPVGLSLSSPAGRPLPRQTSAVTHFLDIQANGILQ